MKIEDEQFENKVTKMLNVKGKLNNMELVEMKYREMDIWKVNQFNFFK